MGAISRRTFIFGLLASGVALLGPDRLQAGPERRATTRYYLPTVRNDIPPPSPKKALAWACMYLEILTDPEILRMPAGYRWLNWGSDLEVYTSDGRPFPPGKAPMLWGVRSPGGTWDPVVKLYRDIPRNYDGELIYLNEPDLEWQANITPQEAADLFAVLAADYQEMKFVAGNVSQRDISHGGPWLREFLALLGPGLRERIWRIGWHWYDYDPYRRDLNYAVETIYSVLAEFGLDQLPSWVTEMGCKRSHPGYLERFELWWRQALAEDRIEQVFAFANRDDGSPDRPINSFGMIELNSGELMDTGLIFAGV